MGSLVDVRLDSWLVSNVSLGFAPPTLPAERYPARSLPVAVASCALIGVAVGTFDYSGQSLRGDTASMSVEEKRRQFFKQPQTTPAIAED